MRWMRRRCEHRLDIESSVRQWAVSWWHIRSADRHESILCHHNVNFKSTGDRNRDQCATVAQLRTGHSPLLAGYLHRIGCRDSATCPYCNGADETAEYLVLHCSAHEQARRDIWPGGQFNTDPRRLWDFLEWIGAVTRPPDREWEREREQASKPLVDTYNLQHTTYIVCSMLQMLMITRGQQQKTMDEKRWTLMLACVCFFSATRKVRHVSFGLPSWHDHHTYIVNTASSVL